MARHELLESILKAQFELEYAEPKDLPACRDRLNQLVDSAIAGRHFTRRDLLSLSFAIDTKSTNARNSLPKPEGVRSEQLSGVQTFLESFARF